MKMIPAIVNKGRFFGRVPRADEKRLLCNKASRRGGFLMAGNMTLLIGTDDEKVDQCLELIASCAKQRTEVVPSTASYGIGVTTAYPLEVTVGGATIFVTNVERFEKL